MSKDIFSPPTLMKPAGYSHVAKVTGGSLVYIAGQVSADVSGQLVGEGNLEAQAEQVFRNLKAAVEAAGGTMADIIKMLRQCLRKSITNSRHPPPLPRRTASSCSAVSTSSPIAASISFWISAKPIRCRSSVAEKP